MQLLIIIIIIVGKKFQNDFMLNKHNSNSHNLLFFTKITHTTLTSEAIESIYIRGQSYEIRILFILVDSITIMQSLNLKSKYIVYAAIWQFRYLLATASIR